MIRTMIGLGCLLEGAGMAYFLEVNPWWVVVLNCCVMLAGIILIVENKEGATDGG